MVSINRQIVTPPTTPLIVTDADLENHARAKGQPISQLQPYLYAAQNWLETISNRKFLSQTWRVYLDRFPDGDRIYVPFGQLTSVAHVKFTDSANVQYTFDSSKYHVATTREPGEIVLAYSQDWPSDTLKTVDAVEVQFTCGWANPAAVPAAIKQSVLMLAAHFYANRENVFVGETSAVDEQEIPFGAIAMMTTWRIYA
jgi:uncharacterized phiE125 gp8 family phage protein